MPIEIRELVIRATIASQPPTGVHGSGQPGDGEGVAGPPVDMEAIVQECVRQVLRVLARERER